MFREVFLSFRKFLRSFRKFCVAFGRVRTHLDPSGPIGMHADAIGSIWKRLDVFEKELKFPGFFRSFFQVSDVIFTNNFCHGAICLFGTVLSISSANLFAIGITIAIAIGFTFLIFFMLGPMAMSMAMPRAKILALLKLSTPP